MTSRISATVFLGVCALGLAGLQAAGVSEKQADAFTRKVALVNEQADAPVRRGELRGPRRTPFTEAEVNSWMVYRGKALLPVGVSEPTVTIVGNGRVKAGATVDLDAIAKHRSTGRLLDPWSYLGGRLPVTLAGTLHTQFGIARFEIEEAAVSGVPVPKYLLQDMVSYYSRSSDVPDGVRLDDMWPLPAHIQEIELGQGQAVVVQ